MAVLAATACVGPITEYSDEASEDPSGDGDSPAETAETESSGGDGDGDGEPGDGDGDGDLGDGDGDGEPGDGDGDGCEPDSCAPGYECVADQCELSKYPWGNCGWDPANEWYECNQMGESPLPEYPIDCGDLPLVDGAPCPAGLTGTGCCAYGGDSWWCTQEGKVKRDPCGGA